MTSPIAQTTAALAREMAAAIRAGVPLLPAGASPSPAVVESLEHAATAVEAAPVAPGAGVGAAAVAGDTVAVTMSDALERVVADGSARLPAPLGAVLATAAAGGDGHAVLTALLDDARSDRSERWRQWIDAAYPLLVCGLALAGILSLSAWYGPLVGAVSESLSRPRAGTRFDAGPVIAAVRGPATLVLVLAGMGAAALLMRSAARRAADRRAATLSAVVERALVSAPAATQGQGATSKQIMADLVPGADGGLGIPPLLAHAEAEHDPAKRADALATVADHYRRVTEWRSRQRPRLPVVYGTCVAGAAVLLYGLALFWPLVTLVYEVAARPPVEVWEGGS